MSHSAGKGTCCQPCQPEFNPQNHGRELLSCDFHMHYDIYAHMHIHMKITIFLLFQIPEIFVSELFHTCYSHLTEGRKDLIYSFFVVMADPELKIFLPHHTPLGVLKLQTWVIMPG